MTGTRGLLTRAGAGARWCGASDGAPQPSDDVLIVIDGVEVLHALQ